MKLESGGISCCKLLVNIKQNGESISRRYLENLKQMLPPQEWKVNSKVPESNQPRIQAMHGLSVKDVPSVDSAELIFGIEELGDSAKNP